MKLIMVNKNNFLKILLGFFVVIITIIFWGNITESNAEEGIETWDVSENQDASVIAQFNDTNNTLTISGNGKIQVKSYNSYAWYNKKSDIHKLVISNGIENVPNAAFQECENIDEIILGNTIKSIGYEAFAGCVSIKHISLPTGLETIGQAAFQKCRSLEEITIPNSITKIGGNFFETDISREYPICDVFRYCTKLENILVETGGEKYSSIDGVLFDINKTILICYPEGKKTENYIMPDSVIKIGAFGMFNINCITNIQLSNSLNEIGSSAFKGCKNISEINFTAGINKLGYDIFEECTKLKNINVDNNNTSYSSIDGVLFDKSKKKILRYPIGRANNIYNISSSVNEIGGRAFKDCEYLKNITIPNSVVNIGGYAFENCTALTEIVIPESVKILGNIFTNCRSLQSVTLPSEVDYINTENMFKDCINIEEIIIPEGTEELRDSTFQGCVNLSSVKLPDSLKKIERRAFRRCSNIKEIQLPNTQEVIEDDTFSGTGIEILNIPSNITTIESEAFGKCRNLKQINIPNNVTSVKQGAFRKAKLTIKVEADSSETYEIELPDIIKRIINSNDILYSTNGIATINCTINNDKIIANKDMLENGKVSLYIRSGAFEQADIAFELDTYKDEVAPFVEEIDIVGSQSKVYNLDDTIKISVRYSEFVKGISPNLIIKFGNGENKILTVSGDIDDTLRGNYLYKVQEGDNGLLSIVSLQGGDLEDWSGNKLNTNNIPQLSNMVYANTMDIDEEEIKEEYHITDKEGLIKIRELLKLGVYNFNGSKIYLENDIDLECSEENIWEPIGTEYNPFKGIFDGKGHKIKNIYINSNKDNQGFFGYNSGTIINLRIESGYIQTTGNYVGGISARNTGKVIIKSCYNKATIIGNNYVGGISGYNNNSRNGKIEIIKCYNEGNVTSNTECAAGIISRTSINGIVDQCSNSGKIVAEKYASGIASQMYGDNEYPTKVTNCYNTGDIHGFYLRWNNR